MKSKGNILSSEQVRESARLTGAFISLIGSGSTVFSGWDTKQGALPSLVLTITDIWRDIPGGAIHSELFEKLLFQLIKETLWFKTWLPTAEQLTEREEALCVPQEVASRANLQGLNAMTEFIKGEALRDVDSDWWSHPSTSGRYAFRVDFEAALTLALTRLSLLAFDAPESKEAAKGFIDSRRNYLTRWLEMENGGGKKATGHARQRLALALLWDLFAVPLRLFSDQSAANVVSEVGFSSNVRIYQDSVRGRYGLRLPSPSKPVVKRWDTRETKPRGDLETRISREGARAHGWDPLEIHTLLESRFPDRKITIR